MKMNKKGFTLIEMLVVIAIIAVLVAIVIPTVNTATEKAKEAADVANIRSAIATVTTNGLSNGSADSQEVTMTQKETGFQSADITSIGGAEDAFDEIAAATAGTKVTISWADNDVIVTVGETPAGGEGGEGGGEGA